MHVPCTCLQRGKYARHHSLEAAEVDVRAAVEALKELLGVLGHSILDVDLAAVGLGVLAADGVGAPEALGVTRLDLAPLIIVEQTVGGGHLVRVKVRVEVRVRVRVRVRVKVRAYWAYPFGAAAASPG